MAGGWSGVFGNVDVVVFGDCDGGSVGVYAVAVPEGGVYLVVHRCLALFDLVEEEIIVFNLERIDGGLLVCYERIVLAGV